MTKYKEYVNRMMEQNKELFDEFKKLHDQYSLNEEKWQEEFNRDGEKVLTVIREWEDKLCRQSEKAGFGNYTTNLAEKFQAEVRRHFHMIDHIGIIVKKPARNASSIADAGGEPFLLKKITLN